MFPSLFMFTFPGKFRLMPSSSSPSPKAETRKSCAYPPSFSAGSMPLPGKGKFADLNLQNANVK